MVGKKRRPSRSEAIRRLVEIGHRFDGQKRPFVANRAEHAEKLAGAQIDKMSDASATGEERTERKCRLTRGPTEFRQGRLDQPRKLWATFLWFIWFSATMKRIQLVPSLVDHFRLRDDFAK